MKLHAIRLRNLNSLYGEQSLDLDADLDAAPLFLIMGPTGAGKSTLMDAVSLALFGTTPRLTGHASSRAESDARQVLSRGEGEGWAEVEFSKQQDGTRRRYRARWSVRRAHKRPDGAFQAPARSLEQQESDGSWTLLVSDARKKYYRPVFQRVLEGFTALDFQRSMLLAQGQFAAFLQADEGQRADILERLTDTSIYKSIGVRAAIKRRRADKAVELAEARLEGIHLLSQDELQAQRDRLAAIATELGQRQDQKHFLEERLRWLDDLQRLVAERAVAEAEQVRARLALWRRAPLLARLSEHRRVVPVQALIEAEARASENLRTKTGQRDVVLAEQREAGPAREEAINSRTRANEAARRAQEQLTGTLPAITASLRLDDALTRAQAELDKQTGRLAEEEAKLARSEAQQVELAAALEEHASAVVQAEEALAAATGSEALSTQLGQLVANGEALRRQQQELAELQDELRRQLDAVEAATGQLGSARAVQASRTRALGPLMEAVTREQTALTELLGGADDPARARGALQQQMSALRLRQRALTELSRVDGSLRQVRGALESQQKKLATVARHRRRWKRTQEQLEGQLAQAQADVSESEKDVAALQRTMTYSRDRAQLTPSDPCPLCGSTDHPLVGDEAQAQLDARLALQHARAAEELAAHRQRHAQLAKQLDAERTAWIEERLGGAQAEQLQAQHRQQLAALESQLAELLATAGLDAVPPPMQARTQASGWRQQLDALGERSASIDAAAASLQAARAAHSKAAHERDLASKDVESRQAALTAAQTHLAQLEVDFVGKRDRLRLEGNQLLRTLHADGVDETIEDVEQALAAASSLVTTHRQRQQALADRRAAHDQLHQQLQTASALHQQLAASLEVLRRQRHELAQHTDAARGQADAARLALGGQDATLLKQQLEAGLAQAQRARAEAEAHFHALDKRVAQLVSKMQTLSHEVVQARASTRRAGRALAQALEELSLADVNAARQVLLDAATEQQLRGLERQVQQEASRADVLAGSRQADVALHLEQRPSTLDPDAADVDQLRALLRAVVARETELIGQHGAVGSEINKQERLRREQHDVLAKLDAAREAARLWRRMHELIGRRDGDEFKRFAQALNLGELLSRANHHLSRLAARYRLEPDRTDEGLPRLVFVVIDAWQDDATRPLTTLSGGETFLVSLSLALALAEFRATKMPIETLLLDEGFGTLDPETLNVALGALQHLLQTGTQVGIISHVAGLQERIDARVVVEPLGSGRSQVRCELGF